MTFKRYILICVVVLLTNLKSNGQDTKEEYHQQFQFLALQASHFEQLGQLDSAIVYYQQLADLYLTTDQVDGYLSIHTNIADMFVGQGDFKSAIIWLDSAFSKTIAPFDTENERLSYLECHLFKAYCYEQLGEFSVAKVLYEEARSKFVLQPGHEDLYLAKFLYQPLGNIYTRLGEYEEALRLLDKFKKISASEEDRESEAQAANDVAIVYKLLHQFKAAENTYLDALSLPGLSKQTQGLIQSNLSSLYYETNQIKEALLAVNKAISAFETYLPQSINIKVQQYLGWTYTIKGQINVSLQNYQQATKDFQNALNLSYRAYGSKHRREIAKIYINIGNLYLNLQQAKPALDHFQEALKCVLIDFDPKDSYAMPSNSQLFPENSIFEALDGKANAHKLLYELNNDPKELDYAVENFEQISSVEMQIRKGLITQSSKLLLTEESHLRAEKAIAVAHALYLLKNDEKYLRKAFAFIEHNKAAVLLESIKDIQSKDFANIPQWVLEREQSLKSEKAMLQKEKLTFKLAANDDSVMLNKIEDRLFENEKAWQLLQEEIKENYQNYHALKNSWVKTGNVDEIKTLLQEKNAMMVSYFIGEASIYAVVLAPNKKDFIKIDKDFPLDNQVIALTNQFINADLAGSDPKSFQRAARALYEKLITPLPITKEISRIFIIPDGILGYLPFDLLVESENNADYSSFDYLINRYTISYGFSANVIHENYNSEVTALSSKPFLGVAPIFKGSGEFAYLPFSLFEVEEINALMNGELLTHAEATKAAFKERASAYEILHISSHAAVIDSLPLYSWISFSDHKDRNNDLHKLYLAELYALKLNAKLAVLSACETGRGEFARGEGVMSLARGFAYAGCQSIVTTLWPVNDATTSTIMTYFYQHLSEGLAKDEALRLAKLDYLKSDDVDEFGAHPFFWAAYIPIGSMDPIAVDNPWPLGYWLVLVVVILCCVMLLIKRFK